MKTKVLAVLLLIINAQIFFVSGANPLGIYGVQEVFFGFLIGYTVFYFARKFLLSSNICKTDFFVISVVVFFVASSSLLSYLQFGQPLVWGVVEARLVLANLIYFPLKYFVESHKLSSSFILNTILCIAFAIIVFDALYQLNIFPKEVFPTEIVQGNDEIRSDRSSVGRFYLITCVIYSLVMYVRTGNLKWGLTFITFIYAIFFMLQERQSMIALTLIAILFFTYRTIAFNAVKKFAKIIILLSCSGLILLVFFQNKIEGVKILIFERLLSDSADAGARFNTVVIMFSELQRNNWIGHGALSLLWKDGFHRLYGDSFFIGDVGIIGTIFRLGLLAFPVIIVVSYFLYLTWKKMTPSPNKDVVGLSLLYCIFTLPTSAPMEYRGYFISILLALSIQNRFHSVRIT